MAIKPFDGNDPLKTGWARVLHKSRHTTLAAPKKQQQKIPKQGNTTEMEKADRPNRQANSTEENARQMPNEAEGLLCRLTSHNSVFDAHTHHDTLTHPLTPLPVCGLLVAVRSNPRTIHQVP